MICPSRVGLLPMLTLPLMMLVWVWAKLTSRFEEVQTSLEKLHNTIAHKYNSDSNSASNSNSNVLNSSSKRKRPNKNSRNNPTCSAPLPAVEPAVVFIESQPQPQPLSSLSSGSMELSSCSPPPTCVSSPKRKKLNRINAEHQLHSSSSSCAKEVPKGSPIPTYASVAGTANSVSHGASSLTTPAAEPTLRVVKALKSIFLGRLSADTSEMDIRDFIMFHIPNLEEGECVIRKFKFSYTRLTSSLTVMVPPSIYSEVVNQSFWPGALWCTLLRIVSRKHQKLVLQYQPPIHHLKCQKINFVYASHSLSECAGFELEIE